MYTQFIDHNNNQVTSYHSNQIANYYNNESLFYKQNYKNIANITIDWDSEVVGDAFYDAFNYSLKYANDEVISWGNNLKSNLYSFLDWTYDYEGIRYINADSLKKYARKTNMTSSELQAIDRMEVEFTRRVGTQEEQERILRIIVYKALETFHDKLLDNLYRIKNAYQIPDDIWGQYLDSFTIVLNNNYKVRITDMENYDNAIKGILVGTAVVQFSAFLFQQFPQSLEILGGSGAVIGEFLQFAQPYILPIGILLMVKTSIDYNNQKKEAKLEAKREFNRIVNQLESDILSTPETGINSILKSIYNQNYNEIRRNLKI